MGFSPQVSVTTGRYQEVCITSQEIRKILNISMSPLDNGADHALLRFAHTRVERSRREKRVRGKDEDTGAQPKYLQERSERLQLRSRERYRRRPLVARRVVQQLDLQA